MALLNFRDIIEQFHHVDDSDVMEKAVNNPALRAALELIRPTNWRGSGLTPEQILPVATDSGIPVAWLPSADILRELVDADPADRMAVLRRHEDSLLRQCRDLLAECDDEWVVDHRILLKRALDTYEAGYFEAAMALAVAVSDPLALWASQPRVRVFHSEKEQVAWERRKRERKYGLAELQVSAVMPGEKLQPLEVTRQALLGPIPKFFTPFHARPGEAIPDTLSRHATVHQPTVEHLSLDNALVALMLGVSILREVQDWAEQVRFDLALDEER